MARKSDKQMEVDAKLYLERLGYELIPKGYFKCIATGKVLSVKQQNFYQTDNPNYSACKVDTDGGVITVLPYCKKWIEDKYKKLSIDSKGNEKLAMYKLCQMLQLPWLESHWQDSVNNRSVNWKYYIGKMNSLQQFDGITIEDSDDFVGDETATFSEESSIESSIKMKKRDKKEALGRWGSSWSESQLSRLEEFYHNMKSDNEIETSQDEDYVRKLARLSVKIDDAIENDESSKAKQLGDLYSKYMSDAKFRKTDMSGKDASGGARTMSQIAEEVESDDFIPPWEKYANKLKVSQDIVDRTIMYMLNFVLRFKDRSQMSEPPIDTPKVGEEDEF